MGVLKATVFISCVCLVSSQVTSRDVVIEQGTVRGYNDENVGVFSFYGIPYASAPHGDDRFKAPLPPPTWNGTFDATTRDIICPQQQPFGMRTVDCLVINVFAPVTNETRLPVFVYIHGGGFRTGAGREYNPVNFATRGVVAVNFNYRLGVYGFLCLGTEFAPGNAGFKDQSAALKWVQNNIAQFGGDPDNVMIAGSSAGGISAELQILSPMSNGLFHKAGLESACATSFITIGFTPIEVAESVANTYGVETGQDLQLLEEFYKSLTDEQLSDGYLSVGTDVGFKACIETHNIEGVETFLDALPTDIIKSGNYEKRPIITGFTSMEGLAFISQYNTLKLMMEDDFYQFLPIDLTYRSETDRVETTQKIFDFYFPTGEITYEGFTNFHTDSTFLYPHVLSARLHTNNSVPSFLYMWSFNGSVNFPDVALSPVWGPGHVAQSLYLLDFFASGLYAGMTADDFLLQDRIREIYLNFAKYGEPIPSRTQLLDAEWLPVTQQADNYLDFDVDLSFGQSPLKERLEFWEQIYAEMATDSASRSGIVNIMVFATLLILGLN